MREFKLIVAGGRDFSDYGHLSRVLFAIADVEYAERDISIVSGRASGADALGYHFAQTNHVTCYSFPADWAAYGKAAGFVRNAEMGNFADGLLAFWDGKSRGTAHMIDFMRKHNKPVTIINY